MEVQHLATVLKIHISWGRSPCGMVIITHLVDGAVIFSTISLPIIIFFPTQDVDPAEANIMATAQKAFHQSEFVEKSGPPAWKQLPTWYQISEADHMISPDVQHTYQRKVSSQGSPFRVLSSFLFPTELCSKIWSSWCISVRYPMSISINKGKINNKQ